MKKYSTKQEAVSGLHEKGFVFDFQVCPEGLLWVQSKTLVSAGEIVVSEWHHFTEGLQQKNGLLVAGIEVPVYGVKGILIRHYAGHASAQQAAGKLHRDLQVPVSMVGIEKPRRSGTRSRTRRIRSHQLIKTS